MRAHPSAGTRPSHADRACLRARVGRVGIAGGQCAVRRVAGARRQGSRDLRPVGRAHQRDQGRRDPGLFAAERRRAARGGAAEDARLV
eukprot:3940194-Prymnesium_polylepis.1